MSRVGKKPIELPGGVTVAVEGRAVKAKGPLGELEMVVVDGMSVSVDDGTVSVDRQDETRESRSLHGLTRSLIANMVEGVSKGYTRQLRIEGVGFRAAVQGRNLSLSLGFASPKIYAIPEGVTINEQGGTQITVSGMDKQMVGEAAARIRSYFPVEPYKGKGIRYADEVVRRKVGKTVS